MTGRIGTTCPRSAFLSLNRPADGEGVPQGLCHAPPETAGRRVTAGAAAVCRASRRGRPLLRAPAANEGNCSKLAQPPVAVNRPGRAKTPPAEAAGLWHGACRRLSPNRPARAGERHHEISAEHRRHRAGRPDAAGRGRGVAGGRRSAGLGALGGHAPDLPRRRAGAVRPARQGRRAVGRRRPDAGAGHGRRVGAGQNRGGRRVRRLQPDRRSAALLSGGRARFPRFPRQAAAVDAGARRGAHRRRRLARRRHLGEYRRRRLHRAGRRPRVARMAVAPERGQRPPVVVRAERRPAADARRASDGYRPGRRHPGLPPGGNPLRRGRRPAADARPAVRAGRREPGIHAAARKRWCPVEAVGRDNNGNAFRARIAP